MGDSHSTASGDIETCQLSLLVYYGYEADVVREHVNIVGRRDGHGDLELEPQTVSMAMD